MAMGKSKRPPSLGRSAGAKLTVRRVLDINEVRAGVKAGSSQQQWKAEVAHIQDSCPFQCIDPRRDDVGNRRQSARDLGATCGLYSGRLIDHRRRSMPQYFLGPRQGDVAKISVPDGIHHQFMMRQGHTSVVEFRVDRVYREAMIVDPQLRRNIAAACGHEHQ